MTERITRTICKCKLEDGRVVEYDLCDKKSGLTEFLGVNLRELGKGTVYSVNGVLQKGSDELYFYVRA